MTLGQTERPHAAGVEEACETEPMTLLPPNARIAVVAPAGPIHPERLDAGLDVLRRWGFTPVEAPALRHRHDLFAGTLADRTADLEWALTDPDLHAVWFARGGYGTAEVVHALDPSALCVPRLVIGYSDATALISARVNLHQPSLHGPVVQELGAWPDDALTPLHRTLTQDSPWTLPGHQLAGPPRTVEGTLAGGNLTVLASLVGTPHRLCSSVDLPSVRGLVGSGGRALGDAGRDHATLVDDDMAQCSPPGDASERCCLPPILTSLRGSHCDCAASRAVSDSIRGGSPRDGR